MNSRYTLTATCAVAFILFFSAILHVPWIKCSQDFSISKVYISITLWDRTTFLTFMGDVNSESQTWSSYCKQYAGDDSLQVVCGYIKAAQGTSICAVIFGVALVALNIGVALHAPCIVQWSFTTLLGKIICFAFLLFTVTSWSLMIHVGETHYDYLRGHAFIASSSMSYSVGVALSIMASIIALVSLAIYALIGKEYFDPNDMDIHTPDAGEMGYEFQQGMITPVKVYKPSFLANSVNHSRNGPSFTSVLTMTPTVPGSQSQSFNPTNNNSNSTSTPKEIIS